MLNNKSILITGGTGSFGKQCVRTILASYHPKKIIVYSRDELKQFEMAEEFPDTRYPCMRYFIGDVRDKDRLMQALQGVHFIIHAAALKQVPAAEYNPFEAIKTNVLGAQNVIDASLGCGVRTVVALSTDKAAAPINLYGATKLCSDKLFTSANNIRGHRDIKLSVVRYGNVMGSRGSVIPYFLTKRKTGVLPITDPEMTRFNISIAEGVEMVLWAMSNAEGGEIFVPKIPSYKLSDVAEAIGPKCEHRIIGSRPGEKLHEEMITTSDSLNTVDLGHLYAILPSTGLITPGEYCERHGMKPVPNGFSYNSGTNPVFLTVAQIRELVRTHVDPAFVV